jgi:subtilisin family serine protease
MHKFVFILCAFAFFIDANAQRKEVPNGWHLMDKQKSGYYGISLQKAYDFLKAKKIKSTNVLVAVIDSGIDTLHEDLKPVLWRNSQETEGNGIDDDNNGFVDDINGYNFLGGRDGANVKEMSYEIKRVYFMYKSKYEGKDESKIDAIDKKEFDMWKRAEKELTKNKSEVEAIMYRRAFLNAKKADSLLQTALKLNIFKGSELQLYKPETEELKKAKGVMLNLIEENVGINGTNITTLERFEEFVNGEEQKEKDLKTPPEDLRAKIIKDDPENLNDLNYGNGNIMAETPFHGTHCSGIIGAVRGNKKGIEGIADNIKIMMVRAVPDGDEHDKDVANAIRYAVDNGAKIISMSFGKDFSPYKKWVDDAIKYAEQKEVLLLHAAGNDSKDVDTEYNFPCAISEDGLYRPNNYITVGASGANEQTGIVAYFSNYGKKEVDVFAPGNSIYSTVPGGNTYDNASGTSMACPVVAGIAALLLEYFPTLSTRQIKMVIEKSAVKPKVKIKNPATYKLQMLSDISVTGGIVNAFEAVKLAATIKGERK